MIRIAEIAPAWLLGCIPVKLARAWLADRPRLEVSLETLPKQLLVDVSVIYLQDARTGIQRAVRSLIGKLLEEPPLGYNVCPVFATRQHGYCYANPNFLDQPKKGRFRQNCALQECVQTRNGDLFLALDLAAHLLPRHKAQILQWKLNYVKIYVVVYDLLPLQHPSWFNPKTTRNFRSWIKWLATYADGAVCISETVRQDMQEWISVKFDLPNTAIPASIIKLGADIASSAPSRGIPVNGELFLGRVEQSRSILMVGTLEPRKGYDQVLAATEILWRQSKSAPMLVIVGRLGWKTKALEKKIRNHDENGKRLFWLEDASDEYLTRLYLSCTGVLVASRAEGFGLPLVEAAFYRKPILARDLPVFRELGIKEVDYFNDSTPVSLAETLSSWLNNIIENQPLIHTESDCTRDVPMKTWKTAYLELLKSIGLRPNVV